MAFNPVFEDSSDGLAQWRSRLVNELALAQRKLAPLVLMQDVEVTFRTIRSNTLSISGECLEPGKIDIYLDPEHPDFPRDLATGDLRRTLYHEYHHALRCSGPGYGNTLGEALVSEGLAQHFEQEVEDGPPPVYAAIPGDCNWQAITCLADSRRDAPYDHREWFHGSGGLPNWTGYALGYQMMADYLEQNPAARPSRLWNTPASALFLPLPQSIMQFPKQARGGKLFQFD